MPPLRLPRLLSVVAAGAVVALAPSVVLRPIIAVVSPLVVAPPIVLALLVRLLPWRPSCPPLLPK